MVEHPLASLKYDGHDDEEDDASGAPLVRLPDRVLGTEADAEEARRLLTLVQGHSDYFKGFSASEVRLLERCLSVIYISEGDEILCKGQEGTFWCLVLEGSVRVLGIGDESIEVFLHAGAIVGEMALFTGGIRNADTVGVEDATLAVMSFAELEAFKAACPELGAKLNTALARACVAKMLSMELHGRQLTLERLPSAELDSRMAALQSGQQKLGWAMRSVQSMGAKAESLYRRALTAKAERESASMGSPDGRHSSVDRSPTRSCSGSVASPGEVPLERQPGRRSSVGTAGGTPRHLAAGGNVLASLRSLLHEVARLLPEKKEAYPDLLKELEKSIEVLRSLLDAPRDPMERAAGAAAAGAAAAAADNQLMMAPRVQPSLVALRRLLTHVVRALTVLKYRAVDDPPWWTLRAVVALHIKLLPLLLGLSSHVTNATAAAAAASSSSPGAAAPTLQRPRTLTGGGGGGATTPRRAQCGGGLDAAADPTTGGGPGALQQAPLALDALLQHRGARLFWVQYFGRHEAVVRWRELRDALQQEYGKQPSEVLSELRSALDESRAGEVHIVDFALFTDAHGVAACIRLALLPPWQQSDDASRDCIFQGLPPPRPVCAQHDPSLLKRTILVRGATRTQLRNLTALRTALAVCGNIARAISVSDGVLVEYEDPAQGEPPPPPPPPPLPRALHRPGKHPRIARTPHALRTHSANTPSQSSHGPIASLHASHRVLRAPFPPHLTAVAPLNTSTGHSLRPDSSRRSRGDALRAGDSADDVSQETPKGGGGAGGMTDRRQAKRGSIAALGAVGGTSTNLAPNQLGASVAGTRTTAMMSPVEKIKKLMAVMDLRGLSDGFLTASTLVIDQGRTIGQARDEMRERDERRRMRNAERSKGHAHADEVAQLHRQWLLAELEEREAEEDKLLLDTALAETAPNGGALAPSTPFAPPLQRRLQRTLAVLQFDERKLTIERLATGRQRAADARGEGRARLNRAHDEQLHKMQREHLAAEERLRAARAAADRTGASEIAALLEQHEVFDAEHPPTAEIDDVLSAFALYLGEATQSYVAARAELPRRTTPLPPNPAATAAALGAADASTWLGALSELTASDLAALQLLATLRADGSQRSVAATTPDAHRSAAPMALSPLSLRSHAPPGSVQQLRPATAGPALGGGGGASSSHGSQSHGSASSLASLSNTSTSAGARIAFEDTEASSASTRYNHGSNTSLSSDSYSGGSKGSGRSLFPAPPPFAKGGRSAPSVSIDGKSGDRTKAHRGSVPTALLHRGGEPKTPVIKRSGSYTSPAEIRVSNSAAVSGDL